MRHLGSARHLAKLLVITLTAMSTFPATRAEGPADREPAIGVPASVTVGPEIHP